MRAFVVGLVVGGVLGAPGCGDTSCPQTCNGCCDSSGKCVAVPDNRSSSTCGLKGKSCFDCAAGGALCELSTLTCVSGTDAGVGFCGCSLPTGACATGTTAANCGSDAGACMTCDAGLTCSTGACVPLSSDRQVGSPCVSSAECQVTLGAGAVCKLQTSSGSGLYVGGYCTVPCTGVGARCPAGSTCVTLDAEYGEADTLCWDNCLLNGGDPCRAPGYRCYTVADGGAHACWISPLPPLDAGPPADKVGLPCDAGVDCQSPPDRGGVCLGVETDRHWMDGYCSTASCTAGPECSADGGAVCASFSSAPPRCLRRCERSVDGGAPDAGSSSCRSGYLCQPAALSDGGQMAGGVCAPALPPPPERTGAACVTPSDCLVPIQTVATCLAETLVAADGGQVSSGYPGGLCTRLGCQDDSACAADGGGVCQWLDYAAGACFQACELAAPGCRAGYVCRSARLRDGGLSPRASCAPRCDAPGNACPDSQSCDVDAGTCR